MTPMKEVNFKYIIIGLFFCKGREWQFKRRETDMIDVKLRVMRKTKWIWAYTSVNLENLW